MSKTIQEKVRELNDSGPKLFVGGPLDGKFIATPAGLLRYEHIDSENHLHYYERQHFIDTHAYQWVIYALNGKDAFQELYKHYKKS